jgi:hypothetical protein
MGGLSAEHKGSKGSQRGQLSPMLPASGAPTSAFPAKTRNSAGGQANHARRPSGLGRSRPGVHTGRTAGGPDSFDAASRRHDIWNHRIRSSMWSTCQSNSSINVVYPLLRPVPESRLGCQGLMCPISDCMK